MPWASVEELLGRLDASLDEVPDGDAADPLRDPWRELSHQISGSAAVKRSYVGKLEDLASSEDRVRTGYRGRFAIELLQNAQDACADGVVVGHAWIAVTDTALLVGNQGLPFDDTRLGSLTRLGSSSKEAGTGHHTIGYKGIGFSSVFEITDDPQVISRDYRFGFNRAAAQARIGASLGTRTRQIPVRRFPFPLLDADWAEDAAAVQEMLRLGAATVIRLPFTTPGPETREQIDAEVRSSLPPEVLLFMPALDGLTFLGDHEVTWTRRRAKKHDLGSVERLDGPDPRSWLILTERVKVPRELTAALKDDLWADVKDLGAAVAVPWVKNRPDAERGAQAVHVYFPTDDRLGRSLLVHGDFYVDSTRRHIEERGPGRAVNGLIGEAVAALVAKAAHQLAPHGNALLRCVAPAEGATTNGFGTVLAQEIDRALAETRFLRSAGDQRLRQPDQLHRLGTTLGEDDEDRLLSLLTPRADVLAAGDARGVGDFLASLGVEELEDLEIARRLDPRGTKLSYTKVLTTLSRWRNTVRPDYRLDPILVGRPIVQDTDGRWRPPRDVVIRGSKVPLLPPSIRPRELARPRGEDLFDFVIDHLEVEELTADVALDRLLTALEERRFGTTDAQRGHALEFLFRLWRHAPRVFDRKRAALASVKVPVGRARSQKPGAWRAASSTYFSNRQVPDSPAARLYAPLGQDEFLIWEGGDSEARWTEFFRMLGVTELPRSLPPRSMQNFWGWQNTPAIQAARTCPEGHPQSPRAYRGDALDRLDQLLALDKRSARKALAGYLVSTNQPLGPEGGVRCENSSHGANRGWRKTTGYQEWTLRSTEWLPVKASPFHDVDIADLDQAWCQVGSAAARSVLPMVDLDERRAKELGCANGAHPEVEQIERALQDLAGRYRDLDDAPVEVQETADWLLRRLDGALGRRSSTGLRARVALPASSGRSRVWSEDPITSDLVGLETLELARLEPGAGKGLRPAYGLARASDVVDVSLEVEPAGAHESEPVLPDEVREAVLAYLRQAGLDLEDTAKKLGRLDERPCRNLVLRLSRGDARSVATPGHHLRNERVGRTVRGRLYLEVGAVNRYQLAEDLAVHLDAADQANAIVLLLDRADHFLLHKGITASDLDEARAALAEYPRQVDDAPLAFDGGPAEEGADEQGPSDAASGTADPAGDDGATAPDGDGDTEEPGDLEFATAWPDELPSDDSGATTTGSAGGTGPRTSPFASPRQAAVVDPERLRFGDASPRPATPRGTSGTKSPNRDATRSGGGRSKTTAADRERTEETAIAVVTRWAEDELGASVKRVDHLNLGWDLEAETADRTILLEVKGISGNATTIIVTPNELDAAMTFPDHVIAVVTGTDIGRGKLALISDLGTQLDPSDLTPMAWALDQWETYEHDGLHWRQD